MANLPYLKGVRTRYLNALGKEIKKGNQLLDTDIHMVETKDLLFDLNDCKERINLFTEKLQSQSDKLAESLDDSDVDFTEKIVDDDAVICERALYVCSDIKKLEDKIQEKEHIEIVNETVGNPSVEDNLQQMFEYQMKLQNDFLVKQSDKKGDKHPSTVRLP